MESNHHEERDDGNGLQVTPKLLAAFARLHTPRIFVPPSVNDAVINAARRQLAKPERIRVTSVWRWLLWPAFATACVLFALLAHTLMKQPGRLSLAREDLNRDGRVDILDAFQLARELQSGVKPAATLDLNDDGVVDRGDADVIAARGVKLEKGGRS